MDQKSIIWIPGIGVFIILWDHPFPFEGESVGSRENVRSSNYPTNCPWVSEDGSSWVLLEDRSDHYVVHHPFFKLKYLNSRIVLCKTPAFRGKIGNNIKPLYFSISLAFPVFSERYAFWGLTSFCCPHLRTFLMRVRPGTVDFENRSNISHMHCTRKDQTELPLNYSCWPQFLK